MSIETTIKDLSSSNAIKSMLGIYYFIFSAPLLFINDALVLLAYIFISVCLFTYLISTRFMLNMSPFVALLNIVEELRNNPNQHEVRRIIVLFISLLMFFNCIDLLIALSVDTSGNEVINSPAISSSISTSENAEASMIANIAYLAIFSVISIVYSFMYGLYSIVLLCQSVTLTLNSMINSNATENGKVYKDKDAFKLITESHSDALKYVIGFFVLLAVYSLLPLTPLIGFSILLPIVYLPALIAVSAVVIEEIGLGKHQKQEETESSLSSELYSSVG